MRIFGIIILLLIFCRCNQEQTQKREKKPLNVTNTYVVKEDIVENLLGSEFEYGQIRKYNFGQLKLQKKPIRNVHDDRIVDTIYHYYNNLIEFFFYKTQSNFIAYRFQVKSPKAKLANGLHLNMRYKDFVNQMKLSVPKSDTISIGDQQHDNKVLFIFKQDHLKHISYEGYLD